MHIFFSTQRKQHHGVERHAGVLVHRFRLEMQTKSPTTCNNLSVCLARANCLTVIFALAAVEESWSENFGEWRLRNTALLVVCVVFIAIRNCIHQAGNLFEYWSLPRNCTTRKFTLFSCMQKSVSSLPLSVSEHQAMNPQRWCLSVKFRYKGMGLWKRKRLIEWGVSFSAFDWVYPIRRIRWFNAQNKYFLART